MNIINDETATIVVSKPISYLEITSSALSLIMISMLSLFECTKHSPSVSLKDIKLIAIVN